MARRKKQYRALHGRGRNDQLVSDFDRRIQKFRRAQPPIIGVDYGSTDTTAEAMYRTGANGKPEMIAFTVSERN